MINLLAILLTTSAALGSFLVGNTRAVQAHTSLDKASTVASLSEREFEEQIADKLNRSVKTVETHRASLKEKRQFGSGADLVHFAFQMAAKSSPEATLNPN